MHTTDKSADLNRQPFVPVYRSIQPILSCAYGVNPLIFLATSLVHAWSNPMPTKLTHL